MLAGNPAARVAVSSSTAITDYPRPRVPVLPVASWDTLLGRHRSCVYPNVQQVGPSVGVTSGTAAIALALKLAGICTGDKALLPAFHCRSMIEPFLAVGAQPTYYRINEDLSVDLSDIRSKLEKSTKSLLVTHYFGFHQNMPALRSMCDTRGIILIEDCAHAFFGELGGYPLGWYGDYAIASARKFFAIQDGGFLVSARRPLSDIALTSAGWAFNIKAALDLLETAVVYGRLVPLSFALASFLAIKTWLWNKIKARQSAEPVRLIGPGVTKGFQHLDLAWTQRRMSLASRWLIRLSSKTRIVEKRRANYQKLAMGLSTLFTARPLVPHLPDDVVPYMFPLIADQPESIFPVLKNKGMPIWRWEEVQSSQCEVSRRYSQQLLQLPCHQALRDSEIDWMIVTIKAALLEASPQCAVPAPA